MKKKSFLVGALLAHSMFTFADAKFSVADLTIAAGEQRTVAVNVELTDKTELSAFEMDIQLPAGLTFKGFDEVMTTTDYGWVLSRSKITDGKYKFVGYAKPGAKLTPESASNILAFNFDVVASSSFNPKTAGDIEILNPLATDLDKPAPQYAIDGNIITENGDVNGIYRLKGMVNVVTINDGQTEVQFDLTPKHVQTITVELTNPKIEDDPSTPEDESLLGGDPNIRGLQGVIHLPKGLKIKGLGTLAYRTVNEDLTLGVPQEVKDDNGNVIGTDVSFVLWANTAPLRESNIYDSPIFSFDVEGEGVDEYNSRESVITIDNIVASKFKDSNRYTLDDEITVTVDNPNQVAKEDVWNPAVEDYRDQLAAIIADIEKDNSNVDQYIGITDAEAAAAAAIDAYEAAIKEQYEAGVLHEKTADDFKAESDAVEKLLNETIPAKLQEAIDAAADNNKLAQDAIDGTNPAIPEVPANIAKDDTPATDGEPGTIEKAKNEWTAAMQALKEAQEKGEAPFLVILDGITDPHNLGAIIRTAACVGAHGVIVPMRRAAGLTPAAVKASAGAVETIKVARVTNLVSTIKSLKAQGIWIYAADMEGEDYRTLAMEAPMALMIGSEGEGISRLALDTADFKVKLPMYGGVATTQW